MAPAAAWAERAATPISLQDHHMASGAVMTAGAVCGTKPLSSPVARLPPLSTTRAGDSFAYRRTKLYAFEEKQAEEEE